MTTAAIARAMLEAGCTAEQIVAVVCAVEDAMEKAAEKERSQEAERVRQLFDLMGEGPA